MSATCQTCRFFGGIENSDLGRCRRYAPKPIVRTLGAPSYAAPVNWPMVNSDSWCGEHQDTGDWRDSQRNVGVTAPIRQSTGGERAK